MEVENYTDVNEISCVNSKMNIQVSKHLQLFKLIVEQLFHLILLKCIN